MSMSQRERLDEVDRLVSLEAALQASGHCPFALDPASGQITWLAGPQAQRLFGADAPGVDSLAAWLDRVHPDDRQALHARLLDCNFTAAAPAPLGSRHRLRGVAGAYRWIEMSVACHAGTAELLQVGTLQDVTPQREAEQRLALSALILETIREAVTITDRDGTILWVNAAFALLLGTAREPLAGQPLQRFSALSGARRIEQWQEIRDAISRRGAWQGRIDARRLDGVALASCGCTSIAT
jgi:PAS domain-containing protein